MSTSVFNNYSACIFPPADDHYTTPRNAHNTNDHDLYYPSSQSALPIGANNQVPDAALFSQALALLQQPTQHTTTCMQDYADYYTTSPNIRVQTSTPIPAAYAAEDDIYQTPASSVSAQSQYGTWQMYQGMGLVVPQIPDPVRRARSHQRTPSASTVGSNGPASPYTQTPNYAHPHIANTDFAPQEHPAFADQASVFSKTLPTPTQTPTDSGYLGTTYLPSAAAHTGGAHEAMKGFVIDHHNGDGFASNFSSHSGGQSMANYDNNSPATPQSGAGEASQVQNAQYALPQNGETLLQKLEFDQNGLLSGDSDLAQANPNVQLWRSESQAYQDELFNPSTTDYSAAPVSAPKPASVNNFLSPHRNLVTERLQTANLARSHSPTSSAVSRERSPFRDGSPLAPARSWHSPAPSVGTTTGIRQQQKEQADEAELARHRPQLNREPTKTISPKDAMLDYHEQEQPSLFQDSIPAGYKQHNGGTEQWSNNFYGQSGSAFGSLQPSSQQAYANFRASSADGFAGTDQMANFAPLPPQDASQVQNTSYLNNTYAAPKMESNPEFPAHLTTMESSISDNGPQPSSQDSNANTSAPQRPADTRAATGTYTCTYHGCTQRFDSHANLQKHKREFHRSQQQHTRDTSAAATSSGTEGEGEGSTSPRSTASPGPSASGMTSAALMARNSQAGPHKCSRINPSTNKPCNTIFSRPYDLTRHEDTIHNGRKQKVRCPMCREEKTFSRNDALTRHMRVVHPEVDSFGKRGGGKRSGL